MAPNPDLQLILSKEEMIKTILQSYSLQGKETLMIGDTIEDMKAACINGVDFAAAIYGYGSEILCKANPDHELKKLDDLMADIQFDPL